MTDGDGAADPLNPHDLMEAFAVPEFYADGIAAVEMLSGRNVCVTYYRFMRVPGSKTATRVVCGRVIRPRDSLVTGQIQSMLDAQEQSPAGIGAGIGA